MSICNRADGDFDEQACLAGGGAPYGEGASDDAKIRWIDDVPYAQDADGVWRPQQIERDSLEGDLAAIGLRPLTDDPGYYVSSPDVSPNAEFSSDPRGNLIDNRYINYGEAGAATGVRSGGELDATERKRVLGAYGYGDADDPYAGARDARDATRLAEQIRAQRISEAQDAIAMRRQSIQAYQQAQLEGAGFSLPQGTEYFPQLGPNSPAVRSGLADPFRVNPVAFDPSMVLDPGQQWQQDLARLRAGAGG